MSENKKIAKNSLILYVRLLITSITGLFSARYIIIALGASDYGLYAVVGGIVSMMAFINNIMTSATYRFAAFELGKGKEGDVNKVFNISLILHIVLALLTALLAETIGRFYIINYLTIEVGKLQDALFVFRMSIVAAVITILGIPYQGLIIAKEKFIVPASIIIVQSSLTLIMILSIQHYIGNRLRIYALLVSLITFIPPITYFLYAKKHYTKLITFRFQKDFKKYKEMLGFGSWILLGAGASASESYVSALIINIFFGTVVNAAFGIATQISNIVKTFAQNINAAVIPQITKSFSGGKKDRTMELVIYSSKYSFFLMLVPAFPILIETKYLLRIWLIEVPDSTVVFVQVMILNALIGITNAGIPAAIHATGKIKIFEISTSLVAFLALPISIYFFKKGAAPHTIAIVFTIVAIINFFISLLLLKRIINFDLKAFFNQAYLKMIMVTLPLLTLFFVKDFFDESFLRFFGLSGLALMMLFGLIYSVGIASKERMIINSFVKHKLGKRIS